MEEVFFPSGVWNLIVRYMIDFQEHHRVKFISSLPQLCRQRPTVAIRTGFPAPLYWAAPLYWVNAYSRDTIYVLYAQTHHQMKCSNYAHTWQPVSVTVLYTPTVTCPYSIAEIRRRWDARGHWVWES